MKKLHNDEKLIANIPANAGDEISALATVKHNYPALSNQAKMMLTGKFNLAQQWLYKAGSTPYNDDGLLIDYSGEGNYAGLSNGYVMKMLKGDGTYAKAASQIDIGSGDFYIRMRWQYLEHATSLSVFLTNYNTATAGNGFMFYRNTSNNFNFYIKDPLFANYIKTFNAISLNDWVDLSVWRIGEYIYYRCDNITQGIVDEGSDFCTHSFQNTNYWQINRRESNLIWNPSIIFDMLLIGTSESNITHSYTGSQSYGSAVLDISGSNNFNIVNKPVSGYHIIELSHSSYYNLKNGFRSISNDGGSTIVYQPRLYDDSGYPALPSGYAVISNHPAGNFHNGAETKITLENYGAKSYDEMKALAISDNRFELVEDEDGNLSEIKVTKLTETDTEHYTADNNQTQELIESGNLVSPINQTIKLLISGGDNANVAAAKTFLFDPAQMTITAAADGEDGNNIQMVFVVGLTRSIAVVEGATIIITLTYEAGDDISDCTDELDSIAEYITYVIDVDGALSNLSGMLEDGFTPELEVKMITYNGNIIEHPGGIESDDGTITIDGDNGQILLLPCKSGIETTITCDIISVNTGTRPQIIIEDADGNVIDSDTATADSDTLTVSVTPSTDYVYRIWLYATDSGVGASTEFSNFLIDYVRAVINDNGEIYPVIFRTGRITEDMSMTYLEMKEELLRRINLEVDNAGWLLRAESVIDGAFRTLIRQNLKDTILFHGLHLIEQQTITASGTVVFGGASSTLANKPFMVMAIISNPMETLASDYRYVQKTAGYMGLLKTNTDLEPGTDEIYYFFVGDTIYFYPIATAATKKVSIEYVKQPGGWAADSEMLDVFTFEFLQDALDLAEVKLFGEWNRE